MCPDKVDRLVVMDAPIPGIEPWNTILLNPGVWHFNFHGRDAERLVAGRERIYLDRIWNDFTGDPSKPDEDTRNFFTATYAQPGGMRAGFAQFTAFSTDATDNKVFEQTKLTMPVLAVGGEKSFGALQAVIMRHVAINVQEAVVPRSGHWLMEESPVYTAKLVRDFLEIGDEARIQHSKMPNTLRTPQVRTVLDRLFATAAQDDETPRWQRPDLSWETATAQERADASESAYMSISPQAGDLLYILARAKRPNTVIEFGASYGISTIYLAAAVADNGTGHVVTTELSATKVLAARANLEEARLADRVTILLGDAMTTLNDIPGPIDFVLLDAWKELCIPVLQSLEPRLAIGALIVADDINLPSLNGYLEYVRHPPNG